jgi:hypothetical protein
MTKFKLKFNIELNLFIVIFSVLFNADSFAFSNEKSVSGKIGATIVEDKISIAGQSSSKMLSKKKQTSSSSKNQIIIYDLKKERFTFNQKGGDAYQKLAAYKSIFLPKSVIRLSYGSPSLIVEEGNKKSMIVKLKNHEGKILNLILKIDDEVFSDSKGLSSINIYSKLDPDNESDLSGDFKGTYDLVITY